jgi:hypothetical protein
MERCGALLADDRARGCLIRLASKATRRVAGQALATHGVCRCRGRDALLADRLAVERDAVLDLEAGALAFDPASKTAAALGNLARSSLDTLAIEGGALIGDAPRRSLFTGDAGAGAIDFLIAGQTSCAPGILTGRAVSAVALLAVAIELSAGDRQAAELAIDHMAIETGTAMSAFGALLTDTKLIGALVNDVELCIDIARRKAAVAFAVALLSFETCFWSGIVWFGFGIGAATAGNAKHQREESYRAPSPPEQTFRLRACLKIMRARL